MNTRTANEAILSRMQGTQDFHPARGFHPASANLFADWTLEPGDVLTVRSEGTDYAVPVYTMDLSWNGDSTVRVQSSGNKQRDPPSELARRNYGYGRGQKALEDEQDGIKARLVENENSIGLVVTNTQGGKVVNAASIVAGINATTGASTVHIDADHIQLTGDTGIIGKLEAYDVAFADVTCADVWCKDIYPDGDIVEAVDISASNFIDISGTDPVNLGNCYVDVTQSTSGNTVTLTFKTAKGATKDVSFSRATALEGTWDRGILDVEASPQGVHYTDYLRQGTTTVDGNNRTKIPVLHCESASGPFTETGYTFDITADVASAKAAGIAEGEGHFTLTTVTPQGQQVSVTPIKSTSAIRIDSTSKTLYNAGTSTKHDRGASITARQVTADGTNYYQAGAPITMYASSGTETYYNAGTQTKVDRGTKVTVTPVSTKWYFIWHPSSETPTGSYYTATKTQPASSVSHIIRYEGGTETNYYQGNGGSFTVQGTSTSVNVAGNAQMITPIDNTTVVKLGASETLYKGDGGSFTEQGTSVTAYEELSSGGTIYYQANAAATYYQAGTPDSSTYYTKTT